MSQKLKYQQNPNLMSNKISTGVVVQFNLPFLVSFP